MAPQRPGQRRHPPRIQTRARQADEMMACWPRKRKPCNLIYAIQYTGQINQIQATRAVFPARAGEAAFLSKISTRFGNGRIQRIVEKSGLQRTMLFRLFLIRGFPHSRLLRKTYNQLTPSGQDILHMWTWLFLSFNRVPVSKRQAILDSVEMASNVQLLLPKGSG
jgi:hypothetical protein